MRSACWLQVLRKKQLFRLPAAWKLDTAAEQFTPSSLRADHLTKNLCIIYTVMISVSFCVTFLLLPCRDAEFPWCVYVETPLYSAVKLELPNALCVNMHTQIGAVFYYLVAPQMQNLCKIHTGSLLHKLSLCVSSARVNVGL
jgi:hypothetical protein